MKAGLDAPIGWVPTRHDQCPPTLTPTILAPTMAAVALIMSPATRASGGALRVQVPTALPRGGRLGEYSPWVTFTYTGLRTEPYTLKVGLLEENNWHCASTQWCERVSPSAVGAKRALTARSR